MAEHAEATYAKAVKAEYSKDLDSAFRLYVKATEAFLHLSRSVELPRDKAKWKASAGKALERAEKIKGFIATTSQSLTPVGIDHFSSREQFYVLKRGSTVNGRVFPLWDDSPVVSEPDVVFQDPDGEVGLSPEQQKLSPQWRRPAVTDTLALSRLRPQDIQQDIITDCSVCASISVCLEHSARFGSQFGYNVLNRPEPSDTIICPVSQSVQGRYDLRLLMNGAWRRVGAPYPARLSLKLVEIVIDDTLPHNPATDARVCMSSAGGAIWPSLLEKGYMKLMGGYDFPGSNSGIDLHALIGWIPEHLEIKSPSFERERTWRRILNGFGAGNCVLTLGTGVETGLSWQGISLISSHSYAVIDVREAEDGRTLTVLDSRVRPPETEDCRIRHIPWSEIVQIFDSIYLSWNPRVWARNLSFHGIWKQMNSSDQRSTRNLRVQYQSPGSSPESEDEVWVLLTRHVTNTRMTTDFVSLRVELEDGLSPGSADLGEQQRRIATKGTYTNNAHVLARTSLPSQSRGLLSVFASYDGPTAEVGFTISVYAPACATITWDERVQTPPFSTKIDGTLTHKNAGGNSSHPTFMVNPQYHLRVHPPKTPAGTGIARGHGQKTTDVVLTMQMARDIPVNIAVVWSQGERIFDLTQKDLAAGSGAYSYVGDYTIVLSAFEPHQMGSFSLEVESSLAFDLKPIAQEGVGMFDKPMRGTWNAQNAMGSPSFKNYAQNPIFELDVSAPAEVKVRLQLLRPTPSSAINLTIFPASASRTGSLGQHVVTSGGYDDSLAGVVTPQVKLSPGKYWAVPSTYSPGVQGPFRIVVYSKPGRVGVAELGR
ncbi:Calpain catalytic domain-containing protein [Mycena kentingensis (nom. inval.)]|nr:Calpain catalytic domain-containing protein [Mycena kentingensis (nom. inval.)]